MTGSSGGGWREEERLGCCGRMVGSDRGWKAGDEIEWGGVDTAGGRGVSGDG